jgi:hypothetical protein
MHYLLFSYIFLQILAFQTIIKKRIGGIYMSTMVFVNFPVKDVAASTAFYEKLGFKMRSFQLNKQVQWFGMIISGLCY